MKYMFKNQRGVSIFIAIGVATSIMLVALGVSTVIVNFIRGSGNIEIMNQAYFAAEAGLEDALYDISEHKAGYENFDEDVRKTFSSSNNTEFRWKIESLLPENVFENNLYTIPPKGQGNSPNDSDWNILSIGKSTEMSLFTDTSLPGESFDDENVSNISDVSYGLNSLKLKVRTPNDISLQTSESEETSLADDVILTWTFSGEKDPDLVPPDEFFTLEEDNRFYVQTQLGADIVVDRDETRSTEIYESKINNRMLTAGDERYVILDSEENDLITDYNNSNAIGKGLNQSSVVSTIEDFLTNPEIHLPSLKISLVSKLFDENGDIIPFIEYQFVADTAEPLPDEFFTITTTGYAAGFKQTLVSKVRSRGSVSLLDFAIFQ